MKWCHLAFCKHEFLLGVVGNQMTAKCSNCVVSSWLRRFRTWDRNTTRILFCKLSSRPQDLLGLCRGACVAAAKCNTACISDRGCLPDRISLVAFFIWQWSWVPLHLGFICFVFFFIPATPTMVKRLCLTFSLFSPWMRAARFSASRSLVSKGFKAHPLDQVGAP